VREYDEYDLQGDDAKVDNLEDYYLPSGSEERLNAACLDHKDHFRSAWSTACRVQDKIDLQNEKEKRTLIDNRAYFHKVRGQWVQTMHFWEDQVLLGQLEKREIIIRLTKIINWCNKRLKNRQLLQRSGHTWSGVAAVKNNALSIMENMGMKVSLSAYVKYNGKILDHVYTEESARQERSGEDWKREIETCFYGIDS
jgi:hypothetical protein